MDNYFNTNKILLIRVISIVIYGIIGLWAIYSGKHTKESKLINAKSTISIQVIKKFYLYMGYFIVTTALIGVVVLIIKNKF